MPSVVAVSFRRGIEESLSPEHAELVAPARGSGPAFRETHRALMLGDRAARAWAATALASAQVGTPNVLEQLGQLGRPEDASQRLRPVAQRLREGAPSEEQRSVARSLEDLADALAEIDTESDNAGNETAFRAVGEAAAATLVRASQLLGGDEFVIREASTALDDLVAVLGWENQLGPRFE